MTSQGTETALLSLQLIKAKEDFQPRYGGLVERHVRLLMQTDPADWPPLLIAPDDDGCFHIIDGFHRFEAATRLGLSALTCRIDPDADYPDAVLANIHHGLPLHPEDRKIAARHLAELDPSLSYREIGRRTGLNHETVKRAVEAADSQRAEHQRTNPDPVEKLVAQVYRTYAGGHGRSWLGFGHDGNAKLFRRAIEAYREEDRETIAQAVLAFGQACVAAAQPFLGDA
ncbi:MAG: ParB/RepB/Spo0J family partition protein [Fimbriimonadaceae bacterium]|nr:ParB/RepB/Spo0J family partition protein [Fimbriimonadaceae bacterium]